MQTSRYVIYPLRAAVDTFSQKTPEEPIPRLPRRCLPTDAFSICMFRHIVAVRQKLQVVLPRQTADELLIRVRLLPAQLVIEMNDGRNNSQLTTQLQQ